MFTYKTLIALTLLTIVSQSSIASAPSPFSEGFGPPASQYQRTTFSTSPGFLPTASHASLGFAEKELADTISNFAKLIEVLTGTLSNLQLQVTPSASSGTAAGKAGLSISYSDDVYKSMGVNTMGIPGKIIGGTIGFGSPAPYFEVVGSDGARWPVNPLNPAPNATPGVIPGIVSTDTLGRPRLVLSALQGPNGANLWYNILSTREIEILWQRFPNGQYPGIQY